MSAQAALKLAADCGVSLKTHGDKISLKASVRPPPELLAALRRHKAEIITSLRREAGAEPDETELEERAAMAADCAPKKYLDAWAHLQTLKLAHLCEPRRRQAIIDGGLFLDQWGEPAITLGWTAAALFEPPANGEAGGLVWQLEGDGVRALGPGWFITVAGRRVWVD